MLAEWQRLRAACLPGNSVPSLSLAGIGNRKSTHPKKAFADRLPRPKRSLVPSFSGRAIVKTRENGASPSGVWVSYPQRSGCAEGQRPCPRGDWGAFRACDAFAGEWVFGLSRLLYHQEDCFSLCCVKDVGEASVTWHAPCKITSDTVLKKTWF